MIKKAIAYSFLILANLILMVYAILPHHHHCTEVFFTSSHCASDVHEKKHHSNDKNHTHEEHDSENCCNLKQLVFVNSSNFRLVNIIQNDFITFNKDITYISKLSFISNFNPEFSGLFERISNNCNFTFTESFKKSSGLRAPPVV